MNAPATRRRYYWSIEGWYGKQYGWEEVTAEDTRREALARLREYRENEPGTEHRMRRRWKAEP